ncbi:MAG: hypothetical protein QNJ44_16365 [Rhodobacter sp.]|nr:hypothetical protein [Rhodobacter sp.]
MVGAAPIPPGTIERPVLTFPAAEAAWVRQVYDGARVILEYGSGGSTVLAGEMLGATVFSVESDRDWVENMRAWFEENPPLADVRLHPVDIGRTRAWGHPAGNANWRQFHKYPISVWDRPDFRHPDVVLIDGRFRAACLLTALFRIERPVTVLFDDYVGRKPYKAVETFAEPVETRGRMVRFDLEPRRFPPAEMGRIMEIFTRAQ